MNEHSSHWDRLHENQRFRPRYPNDHVVRFLISNKTAVETTGTERFLDIGAGAGRHMRLASELGLDAYGTDTSMVGLQHAQQQFRTSAPDARLVQASMTALPFADCSFALALSFGVFYYGTAEDMRVAIAEAHRVLAPTGKLFAVLRTTQDYRFGKGEQLEKQTFRLKITETNEYDTVQHFLKAEDIETYFEKFSEVGFEKTETTSANRTRIDSDWLITARK
jgi:SAM-dependent methyltransferase